MLASNQIQIGCLHIFTQPLGAGDHQLYVVSFIEVGTIRPVGYHGRGISGTGGDNAAGSSVKLHAPISLNIEIQTF